MPAKSKVQQKAAGAVLSAKRGEMPWPPGRFGHPCYPQASRPNRSRDLVKIPAEAAHATGRTGLKLCAAGRADVELSGANIAATAGMPMI
ncbi:DUF3008 family protein [Paracoccus aestuariivivens]|uniref:DUF3008 family protein n=1 Tax=Paracoccus aestuariivivens TaxID=1820333 RepID=UPI003CCCFB48